MFAFTVAAPRSAPLAALPSTLFHAALVTGALLATRSAGVVIGDPGPPPIDISWTVPQRVPTSHVSLPRIPTGSVISHTYPTLPEIPVLDPFTPGTAPIDPRTLVSGDPAAPGTAPVGTPLGSASTIFQESEVDDPPTLLIGATPRYPRVLAEAGIDGKVTLTLVIDTLGRVVAGSVQAGEATHSAFVPAAEEAVYASRFRPAHRRGAAVAVRVRQGVVFRH